MFYALAETGTVANVERALVHISLNGSIVATAGHDNFSVLGCKAGSNGTHFC